MASLSSFLTKAKSETPKSSELVLVKQPVVQSTTDPFWVNRLQIGILTKRIIILEGNVHDMVYSHDLKDVITLPQFLAYFLLEKMGYSNAFIHDKLTKNVESLLPTLENLRVKYEHTQMLKNQSKGASSQTYEDLSKSYDSSSCSNGSCNAQPSPEAIDAFNKTYDLKLENSVDIAKSFISYFRNLTESHEPTTYVLNYFDILSPESNAQMVGQLLKILSKAIEETSLNFDGLNSCFVILIPKASMLPPEFLKLSYVSIINLPKPSAEEKLEVLKEYLPASYLNSNELPKLIKLMSEETILATCQFAKYVKFSHSSSLLEAFTTFTYGVKTNPWEKFESNHLDELKRDLHTAIKGQDHAIEQVSDMLTMAIKGFTGLHHSSNSTPRAVFFFVCAAGVGKTETAKAIARWAFGEEAIIRFDMSEYSHEHDDQKLVGSPPGYVGHSEGGQLTRAVIEKPFSVVLFDEIEKCHPKVLDKFLQILEDGRLTDGRGFTATFKEAVIIFTSNLGASSIKHTDDNIQAKFIDHVSAFFSNSPQNGGIGRPELLNRIGNGIIPFNFLTDTTVLTQIILSKLVPMNQAIKEKNKLAAIGFTNKEELFAHLVSMFEIRNGGRGMLNLLTDKYSKPFAKFLYEKESSRPANPSVIVTFDTENETINFAWKGV